MYVNGYVTASIGCVFMFLSKRYFIFVNRYRLKVTKGLHTAVVVYQCFCNICCSVNERSLDEHRSSHYRSFSVSLKVKRKIT